MLYPLGVVLDGPRMYVIEERIDGDVPAQGVLEWRTEFLRGSIE